MRSDRLSLFTLSLAVELTFMQAARAQSDPRCSTGARSKVFSILFPAVLCAWLGQPFACVAV